MSVDVALAADLLERFEADRIAAGVGAFHAHRTALRVARVARLAGAVVVADLTPEAVGVALEAIPVSLGSSPRRRERFRLAVSGFVSWAIASGRMPGPNPYHKRQPKPARAPAERRQRPRLNLYRHGARRDGAEAAVGRPWVVEFRDAAGVRHRLTLGVRGDRATAEAEVARLEREGFETRKLVRGSLPVYRFEDVPVDLGALVADYAGELRRLERTPGYIADEVRRLLRVMGRAGAQTIEDLTTSTIAKALADLATTAHGQNQHRRALVALFEWLVRIEKWDRANPAKRVRRLRHRSDRVRRALRDEERDRLLAVVPPERAALYRFMLMTGLRCQETASVRVSDLSLDMGTMTVRASIAKSGSRSVLPLTRSTVALLREVTAGLEPDALVFPGRVSTRTFYGDLERAGIPRVTADGVLDLHALRVSFCSALARADVPLQTAQKLMRHRSVDLTSSLYTRLSTADLAAAVARIEGAAEVRPLTLRGGQVDDARTGGMGPIVLRAVV